MAEMTNDTTHSGLPGPAVRRGSYAGFVAASFGHAARMMLRQRRLFLALIICSLPAAIPIIALFFAPADSDIGEEPIFALLVENFHIIGLAPLLALFFAAMLIGQEVEGQTIPYVLVRPIPRLAWVLGRFLAYGVVTTGILAVSILLTCAPDPTRSIMPSRANLLGWRDGSSVRRLYDPSRSTETRTDWARQCATHQPPST